MTTSEHVVALGLASVLPPPKPHRRIRALELFCCSGGLAAGFREAGLEFDVAIDADPDACASYAANLGRTPMQADLRQLLADGWSPGPLDLLSADPPCAMWSRAGKHRGLADERDMLAETVEAIRRWRPRAALIGNIPGLEDRPNIRVVQATIGSLARDGYCVRDFAVIDSASLGVPQIRPRPWWYVHLDGPCLRWPAATHADPRSLQHHPLPGFEPLRPWVTCREALGHLSVEELGRPIRLRKRACKSKQHGSIMARPARVVGTSNLSDGNVMLLDPKHPSSELDAPARTVLSSDGGGSKRALRLDDRGRRARTAQSARVGDPEQPAHAIDTRPARAGVGDAAVFAWPWDRPATTLDTRDVLAPPGRNGRSEERGGAPQPQRAHPDAIVLSEVAAMLLQGFPPGWTICGATKRKRWAQIGQAVPRAVAAAIGRSIVRALQDP